MQWALISTENVILTVQTWFEREDGTKYYEMITGEYPAGTVTNIIVYDGVSPYTPPEGARLTQVPDYAKVGDTGY